MWIKCNLTVSRNINLSKQLELQYVNNRKSVHKEELNMTRTSTFLLWKILLTSHYSVSWNNKLERKFPS